MTSGAGKPDLQQVLAMASTEGRVCPMPPKWARLYELLPNTRRDGYGHIPPAPLILGAWGETSDEDKRYRLKEHLEWAESQGALSRVHGFLSALKEEDWHHVGG